MSTSLKARPFQTLAQTLLVAFGVLAGPVTTPARADEQIVLPFDCNVVGGRVQVRPSGDQAYRIFGARRQEQYRACSEQNPDRCRTFLVHSFKLACGRDKVEWPDVYAAIAKVTDGRAFYNNDGALYYRMGPREPRDSYPFPDARRATGIVEMPAGFAPMAGVDAIFTPLDPRVAELQDPPRSGERDALPEAQSYAQDDARAYRDGPPRARPAEPAFSPALTPKAVEKPKPVETAKPAEPVKPAAPSPQVVLEPKPPESKPPESKPLETKKLETASTEQPASIAPASPIAAPVTPTILNNPVAKEVETASRTETVVAAAEVTPAQPAPQAAPDPRVEGWSATGDSRLSVPPLAFAILIAAATLAVLLLILKRQAAVPAAAGPLRVHVEPTLPGLDRPNSGTSTGQALVVREMPDPPVLSNAVPTGDLPATRSGALALLGLNAEASEPVIRKLVEALRQSWHPDLATSEADRSAREERIKAINAAADILLRKSAA